MSIIRATGYALSGWEAEATPNPPQVMMRPPCAKQALINLVSNAVKFTPKYGRVSISARMDEDGLALSVSDTGIGMRPEDTPGASRPSPDRIQTNRRHDGGGLSRRFNQCAGGAPWRPSRNQQRAASAGN